MRTRKEIEDDIPTWVEKGNGYAMHMILEVLLDIRDLLTKDKQP